MYHLILDIGYNDPSVLHHVRINPGNGQMEHRMSDLPPGMPLAAIADYIKKSYFPHILVIVDSGLVREADALAELGINVARATYAILNPVFNDTSIPETPTRKDQ